MSLISRRQMGLCLGFVAAIALTAFQQKPSPVSRPTALPQDPDVQVYFNQHSASEYTEPYRLVKRSGDDLEQHLVDTINTAQSTVDVAIQELRLPKVATALADRQKAGVRVRVILENNYSTPLSSLLPEQIAKLSQRERQRYNEFLRLVDRNRDGKLSAAEINQGDALVILRNAGIPTIDDTADGSKGSGLMHHKFIVVDDRTVVVTSANFTTSDIHGDFSSPDSRGNPNSLVKIQSPDLATLFTEEFNLMWGNGAAGKPDSQFGVKKPFRPAQQVKIGSNRVTVQFSPTSRTIPWNQTTNGFIGNTLNTATQSVDMALFVFSEQQLADILQTKHQQGVKIRALIDSGFAHRYYSEGLDLMGVALLSDCQYEANNRPWQQPLTTVGVPILPKGDLLHHKFGVIDGKTVITGSHNWSQAANINNDETVLAIQNPRVAAHFQREFDRLYAHSRLGVPAKVQQKIQAEENRCASALASSNATQANSESNRKVNLNTASKAELEALPGVGAVLAERIIQARTQKRFTSLEDFDRVKGVGPSLREKLSDRITW